MSGFFSSAQAKSRVLWAKYKPKTLAYIRSLFPLIYWLQNYNRGWILGDVIGGLTVGFLLVPQGMAYALIAGLPAIYGLYSSLLPLIVYGIFGTSGQLSVAPVAIASLLTSTAVNTVVKYEDDPERYINLALTLALMAGCIQLALGLIRFGVIVNFLSHSVVSGFTSASALIIAFSQVKYIFGVKTPRTEVFYETVYELFKHLGETHGWTVLMALPTIALLLGIQILNRKKKWLIPGALIAVAIGILLSWTLDLKSKGISTLGPVPSGLPAPIVPAFTMADIGKLFPSALTLALVGYMESISVASNIASKRNYRVDPNQELVALGLADLFGAFFRSYPITGGFSRTAVANNAGANSPFAGVIGAIVVGLTLLFLTGIIQYLPMNSLAGIIIVACVFLVDTDVPKELWKLNKKDFVTWLSAVIFTLILGVEIGILIAVGISVLLVMYRISFPHRAFLGRLKGSKHTFRNIKHFPDAETYEGLIILRLDAPVFFANISGIREVFDQLNNLDLPAVNALVAKGVAKPTIATAMERAGKIRAILLDFSGVHDVDSAGAHFLKDLIKDHKSKNVEILFSNLIGPVRTALVKSGFLSLPSAHERFFWTNSDAVNYYIDHLAADEVREKMTRPAADEDDHVGSESTSTMEAIDDVDLEAGGHSDEASTVYSALIFKTPGAMKKEKM